MVNCPQLLKPSQVTNLKVCYNTDKLEARHLFSTYTNLHYRSKFYNKFEIFSFESLIDFNFS